MSSEAGASNTHAVFRARQSLTEVFVFFLLILNPIAVFATTAALTGTISCSVQIFFAWGVKILTSNLWLVTVVVAATMVGAIRAIASTVEAISIGSFLRFQEIKLVGACAADILITAILVWHLYDLSVHLLTSSVFSFPLATIQIGLLTSVCAVVGLIVYLVDVINRTSSPLQLPLIKTVHQYPVEQSRFQGRLGKMFTSPLQPARSNMSLTQVVRFGTNSRLEVFVSDEQHELADVARATDMEDIKLTDDASTASRETWEAVGQKSK
ncbi:uncharacterized protein BT62DRAFT_1001592 [Guyanagaster necrorhizus]|uniref:Transmembrane protein n=1 Tax=Guyanagaster necrorhizus TaxID=856835 RepID=A0A9P7W1S5_9AGAR|nr:uncharacterized protein BT62DRAFT_1001592 [Guyanagaster necrorhizus MCA 3950]KAG7450805.1 hypothetical protein BT62DRAFT_1001592 [Guyanagaster necrorhizus MCA 3950]